MATDAVVDERMQVAVGVALAELEPAWQDWFAQHAGAVDEEGCYVEICLAADEPAEEVFSAMARQPQPAFVATVLEGNLAMIQMFPGTSEIPVGTRVIELLPSSTVRDLIALMLETQGEQVVLSLADTRVMATI